MAIAKAEVVRVGLGQSLMGQAKQGVLLMMRQQFYMNPFMKTHNASLVKQQPCYCSLQRLSVRVQMT